MKATMWANSSCFCCSVCGWSVRGSRMSGANRMPRLIEFILAVGQRVIWCNKASSDLRIVWLFAGNIVSRIWYAFNLPSRSCPFGLDGGRLGSEWVDGDLPLHFGSVGESWWLSFVSLGSNPTHSQIDKNSDIFAKIPEARLHIYNIYLPPHLDYFIITYF